MTWPGLGEERETMAAETPQDTARDAADRLTAALAAMTGQLAAVSQRLDLAEKAARRSRRVIAGVAISLVLDVTLTILVTVAALQAHSASAEASATVAQLHSVQISSCVAGNQTRRDEIAFWAHLADVSITPRTSAAQRRTDAEVLAYVKRAFAPVDCRARYRLR